MTKTFKFTFFFSFLTFASGAWSAGSPKECINNPNVCSSSQQKCQEVDFHEYLKEKPDGRSIIQKMLQKPMLTGIGQACVTDEDCESYSCGSSGTCVVNKICGCVPAGEFHGGANCCEGLIKDSYTPYCRLEDVDIATITNIKPDITFDPKICSVSKITDTQEQQLKKAFLNLRSFEWFINTAQNQDAIKINLNGQKTSLRQALEDKVTKPLQLFRTSSAELYFNRPFEAIAQRKRDLLALQEAEVGTEEYRRLKNRTYGGEAIQIHLEESSVQFIYYQKLAALHIDIATQLEKIAEGWDRVGRSERFRARRQRRRSRNAWTARYRIKKHRGAFFDPQTLKALASYVSLPLWKEMNDHANQSFWQGGIIQFYLLDPINTVGKSFKDRGNRDIHAPIHARTKRVVKSHELFDGLDIQIKNYFKEFTYDPELSISSYCIENPEVPNTRNFVSNLPAHSCTYAQLNLKAMEDFARKQVIAYSINFQEKYSHLSAIRFNRGANLRAHLFQELISDAYLIAKFYQNLTGPEPYDLTAESFTKLFNLEGLQTEPESLHCRPENPTRMSYFQGGNFSEPNGNYHSLLANVKCLALEAQCRAKQEIGTDEGHNEGSVPHMTDTPPIDFDTPTGGGNNGGVTYFPMLSAAGKYPYSDNYKQFIKRNRAANRKPAGEESNGLNARAKSLKDMMSDLQTTAAGSMPSSGSSSGGAAGMLGSTQQSAPLTAVQPPSEDQKNSDTDDSQSSRSQTSGADAETNWSNYGQNDSSNGTGPNLGPSTIGTSDGNKKGPSKNAAPSSEGDLWTKVTHSYVEYGYPRIFEKKESRSPASAPTQKPKRDGVQRKLMEF